jgi:arsenical pump membrane protein
VQQAAAVFSLAVTVGLVLSRPRITPRFRVGPASAAAVGVALMMVAGLISVSDPVFAAEVLWRPLLTVTAIMVMTASAHRIGLLDRLVAAGLPRAEGSTRRLFGVVFFLSALTAAALNNDAAVLLLTPIVVILIRRLYPDATRVILPFAFAVFMAAGVAPLMVSNPMNMIVADLAGIGFNEYAVLMLPISLVGWVVTFLILRWLFREDLGGTTAGGEAEADGGRWERRHLHILVLLLGVLAAYPVMSYFGGPIWVVAATGAVISIGITARHRAARPLHLLRHGVSWETLAFLGGVFLIAIGLRNAGLVEWLTETYRDAGHVLIGGASALGSAVINNHPMALINMLAIQETGAATGDFLAALIGGDLGPRLLPIGSLAGLLWLASLRALDVEVPIRKFVYIGTVVTIPSLAVSLGLLTLLRAIGL